MIGHELHENCPTRNEPGNFYRVLRKYLNPNLMNCEQFDSSRFRDLCKKQ
jgi:hypothetical protein